MPLPVRPQSGSSFCPCRFLVVMPPVSPAPAPRTAPPHPAVADRSLPERVLHKLFKFFSSVRLAVILISVLIIGSVAGTLYESSFNAKVARAYVYDAWWFNFWL